MSADVETAETAAPVEVPKDLQERAAGVVAAYEAVTIDTLIERVNLLKALMKRCMVEGQHHGTIPGTKKPSLWKPGAELICVLFQLGTRYPKDAMRLERDNGHFLFTLTCELFHIPTGRVVGEGVGAGSTMEYRFRIQTEDRYTDHGQPIKAKYTPFDFYNTVLKISRKRSMVDAVLTACGASEIWTQDTEDNPELYQEQNPQPARQSLPKPPPGSPRLKQPKKVNGNGQTKGKPELVTGVVEKVWPNDYEGTRYFMLKLKDGRQVQTKDPELGATLLGCEPGEDFRAHCEPSSKPSKLYLVSFSIAATKA
jgi:hypothetical protein